MDDKICIFVEEILPAYVKQTVSESCRKEVKEHLDVCNRCNETYQLEEKKIQQEETKFQNLAKRIRSRRKKVILGVGVGMILMTLLFNTMFRVVDMGSSSMEPNYSQGESILVSQVSYILTSPKRGDVVVISKENVFYGTQGIIRIIGVPGDEIDFENGMLKINGEFPDESYIQSSYMMPDSSAEYPIRLGEDMYFGLGDNQANAFDSRYLEYGIIKREDIIGKVLTKWFRLGFTRTSVATATSASIEKAPE